MKLSPHHIALKVLNLQICEEFYSDTLGLAIIDRKKENDGSLRSVWFDLDGTILMLEKCGVSAKVSSTNGWHLMALKIQCKERTLWKKKLTTAGIKITSETDYSIYFDDPEGNHLALSHYSETISRENGR